MEVCFYVGKGTLKRARLLSRKENPRYQRIVAKLAKAGLKVDVRIIAQDLSEETAFQIEIARIAELRVQSIPIVNMTDGGEGAAGFSRPASVREKISKTMMGRKVPGRVLSEEHKKAISAGSQGRIVSQETRLKISRAQKGNPRPELIGRKISPAGIERLRNRVFTDDHRRKISEAKKGRAPVRKDGSPCRKRKNLAEIAPRHESVT